MPAKRVMIFSQDELIFSQNAATGAAHEALDHIPGSALLGAVASQLYQSLSPEEQWLVFHSGKVRFGNAYPNAAPNHTSWPMPMSFHHVKGESAVVEGKLHRYFDLANVSRNSVKGQLKQLRSGYVQDNKTVFSPDMDYTMKTAVDYHTGAAKDSQLFGYSMLRSGQWFSGQLSWDDEIERDQPTALQAVFDIMQSGSLRLGRAKSAEFGRAKITLSDDAVSYSVNDLKEGDEFSLLCVSDIAVVNRNNTPVFMLNSEVLGIDGLEVVPAKSFVRTRQYSPYNGARKCYDQERQVISKGSVFTYTVTGDNPHTVEALNQVIKRGIGRFRESGLGQLRPCLIPQSPKQTDAPEARKSVPESSAQTTLITWLKNKTRNEHAHAQAEKLSASLFKQLLVQYQQARVLAATQDNQSCGPNKHNWSTVLETANRSKDDQALMASLFTGKTPLIATQGRGKIKQDDPWQTELVTDTGHYTTFAEWLYKQLQSQLPADGVSLRHVLQLLARRAMSESPATMNKESNE